MIIIYRKSVNNVWKKIEDILKKKKIICDKKETEMVGFEPTCRGIPDKLISSQPRYGLFGTSP